MQETEDVALKNQCRRDRLFQDKKYEELALVHKVLGNEELSDDEKVTILITEGRFGWERAQELVYGCVRYKKRYDSQEYIKQEGRLR